MPPPPPPPPAPADVLRFCPACDYDLRVHAPGAACPECGEESLPAGEWELRGWPSRSPGDGVGVLPPVILRQEVGWTFMFAGLGLHVLMTYVIAAIAPRIFQVRVSARGFGTRFIGEGRWQTEQWLPTDQITSSREFGTNGVTIRGVDPILHDGWFGPGETLLTLTVRGDTARLASLVKEIEKLIAAAPPQADLSTLPRHPDHPDVMVLATPLKRVWSVNRLLRALASPMFGVGILFAGLMLADRFVGSEVIVGIAVGLAGWLTTAWFLGQRFQFGRRREFRIGPEGYQYAKVDAPLSLTPWHSGDGLDVRTTNFMSRPGVLRMRVANSRHYPLASFSYVRLTRPQALSLIMAVRTWRPQVSPPAQPAAAIPG